MSDVEQKVYELAEYFLQERKDVTKEDINELAEYIQEAIEDFLTE